MQIKVPLYYELCRSLKCKCNALIKVTVRSGWSVPSFHHDILPFGLTIGREDVEERVSQQSPRIHLFIKLWELGEKEKTFVHFKKRFVPTSQHVPINCPKPWPLKLTILLPTRESRQWTERTGWAMGKRWMHKKGRARQNRRARQNGPGTRTSEYPSVGVMISSSVPHECSDVCLHLVCPSEVTCRAKSLQFAWTLNK